MSTPTPLGINDAIAAAIGDAFENKTPVTVAYVDSDGQPHLSLRGSVHRHSNDQLAMWIRDRTGGLVGALSNNPRLTFMYRESSTRTTYLFYGRGHVVTDAALANEIYDRCPEGERSRDADRAGVAVIADIDVLTGGQPDHRIEMRRIE